MHFTIVIYIRKEEGGGGGPLEGVGPETHVHKITNVPVFWTFLS
jgi:hypothetical protein